MPTLNLTRLWVNLIATGEGISGASARGGGYTVDTDIRYATYANGRRRAIRAAGTTRELPYTLVAVSLPTKNHLESWLGQAVQVRDVRSQKWLGTFGGLAVSQYMDPALYSVSFTLQELTIIEGA